MAVTGQVAPVKQLCQRHDKPQHTKPQSDSPVPTSWKLTPQQKAFIDSFAEDDASKQ
ncbi:hypothetical protein KXR87_01640 [Yokenella regensburgei]|uniref:hypothetical protein n=1 Tax=Yokenella regensburgei TaxID=158877 RepID=UPI003F17B328